MPLNPTRPPPSRPPPRRYLPLPLAPYEEEPVAPDLAPALAEFCVQLLASACVALAYLKEG